MSPQVGRTAVFRNKGRETRHQVRGFLTERGAERFEAHRQALASLSGRTPEQVGDGDVVEYLARGDQETRDHLIGVGK